MDEPDRQVPDRLPGGNARAASVAMGRPLSPDKGLHFFLPAVALLARTTPLHLTVIAAPGPERYRQTILRQIQRLGLTETTELRPPVARDQLDRQFVTHDVFLFYSIFREPVSQVLLRAMAAGLPVVGPRPAERDAILRPDVTAFCFDDTTPTAISRTIGRATADASLSEQAAARGYALVASDHALGDTIRLYDAWLRRIVALRRDRAS